MFVVDYIHLTIRTDLTKIELWIFFWCCFCKKKQSCIFTNLVLSRHLQSICTNVQTTASVCNSTP